MINDGTLSSSGQLGLSAGDGTIPQHGLFSASGTGRIDFTGGTALLGDGATIGGTGTVALSNSGATVRAQGQVTVNAGGTFLQSAGSFGGSGDFMVGGTFRWTGGTQLEAGLTQIEPGGTLLAPPGTGSSNLTLGPGRTLDIRGTATWNGDNVTLCASGAQVFNEGTFQILNTLHLVGCSSNPQSFTNAGLLESSATFAEVGGFFDNQGTVQVDAGRLDLNGRLLNYGHRTGTLASGRWVLHGKLGIWQPDLRVNAATLTLDGAGADIIDVQSTQSGMQHFQRNAGGGRLTVTGGRTLTTPGPFRNQGAVAIAAGSQLSTTGDYVQEAGSTRLLDGTSTLTAGGAGATVHIREGSLRGLGTVQPVVTVDSGAIRPGLPTGTLTVGGSPGSATVGSDAMLGVDLGGTTPGSFDTLALSGSASLGGTLRIETTGGFVPSAGQSFIVMTFPSRTGSFTTVKAPSIPGISFGVAYSSTAVTVNVTAAGPRPLGATR
jgi:hypothetical protein